MAKRKVQYSKRSAIDCPGDARSIPGMVFCSCASTCGGKMLASSSWHWITSDEIRSMFAAWRRSSIAWLWRLLRSLRLCRMPKTLALAAAMPCPLVAFFTLLS